MFSAAIAFVLLIILSPLFIFFSLIILINDGRPIFFKQKKLGKNHNTFYQYKFRTMKKNTPQKPTEFFGEKDAKSYILKYGYFLRKYSLDELPQLINIIKREMNFIGPRPCMSENEDELKKLREENGVSNLIPGITGWAQVHGRDLNSFEQKAALDEYYLKNKSLFLNIKILLKTIKVVLLIKGIKH